MPSEGLDRIDRRRLLAGGAALLTAPGLTGLGDAAVETQVLISAARTGQTFALLFADAATGEIVHREMLDSRGHDVAVNRQQSQLVLFARRPGTWALVVDLHRLARGQVIPAAPGRHFYGHGAFSADGRLLYASENDYDGERGVIGVYDVRAGFARVGELPSHGLGPHEILLLNNGRTLAVANGGVLTHPDFPRQKLNLEDMMPSLALMNAADGELLQRINLPRELSRLSIRHMAQARDGSLWWGGQFYGDPQADVPLLGHLQPDGNHSLIRWPVFSWLKNYVSSVRADPARDLIAVTSSRAGMAWTVRVPDGEPVTPHVIRDVSGIVTGHHAAGGLSNRAGAGEQTGFLFSDGAGAVRAEHSDPTGSALTGPKSLTPEPRWQLNDVRWDNHMTMVTLLS